MRSALKQDMLEKKTKKTFKKPEAQMRRNRQNMQSGINSYSSRLIEGLGSFGRLAQFFIQFLTNKNTLLRSRTSRENMCLWLNKYTNIFFFVPLLL